MTYLEFSAPYRLHNLKEEHKFITEGSYLSQEESFLTVQLFEGSWLRLSPRSKISPEFDPKTKTITIHLLTGSVKILFSSILNSHAVEKIVVKSADAQFEVAEGKFTVVRNSLVDLSSVYVEKGAVVASSLFQSAKSETEVVHAGETLSVQDRDTELESPRKMSQKEIEYLHPTKYLNTKKKNL